MDKIAGKCPNRQTFYFLPSIQGGRRPWRHMSSARDPLPGRVKKCALQGTQVQKASSF